LPDYSSALDAAAGARGSHRTDRAGPPYGISTLIYGLVADRIGIQRVIFASLAAFSVLTMLTATAQSVEQLTLFRIVTGIGASGVVLLSLALVGRLYP
jgi:MFS family permease